MAAKLQFSGLSMFRLSILLSIAIFAQSSSAIYTAPSSECSYVCGNVLSSTSYTDLVCSDSAYSGSVTGQTVAACLNCELNSTYVDPTSKLSDLSALLYNIRYTTSACLWGSPGNIGIGDNQCVTGFACGNLLNAVQYQNLSTAASTFGYCDLWSEDVVSKCETCIGSLGNRNFLANFFIALDAGCKQKPEAGATLSVHGSLFGSQALTITTPTTAAGGTTYNFDTNSGSLTLGAKVGIAVGALVGILIALGCGVVCLGKRRRRAHLKTLERKAQNDPAMSHFRDGHSPTSSHDGTITGQRRIIPVAPLQTHMPWQKPGGPQYGDSPVSAIGTTPSFSPYVSPVSPQAVKSREWNLPITLSTPIEGKGKGVAMNERDSPPESFEMRKLASTVTMAPRPKEEKIYAVVPIPAPYASPPPTKTAFSYFEGQSRD